MGTADVIPGVSGGTVALITGIYSRLINNLAKISPKKILQLIRLLPGILKEGEKREQLKETAVELDIPFFAVLLLGIITAGGVLSNIIPPLINAFPNQVNAFFLGLVSFSIYYPLKAIDEKKFSHFFFIILGAIVAYGATSQFLHVGLEVSTLSVFTMGAIAINAMILPGVSGAYILKSVGIYTPVLEAIKNFLRFNFSDSVPILIPFGLGVVIGITTFVRLLRWVLSRYHDSTMATLAGLMFGALHTLWPKFIQNEPFSPSNIVSFSLIIFGAAIILTFILAERSWKKKQVQN